MHFFSLNIPMIVIEDFISLKTSILSVGHCIERTVFPSPINQHTLKANKNLGFRLARKENGGILALDRLGRQGETYFLLDN